MASKIENFILLTVSLFMLSHATVAPAMEGPTPSIHFNYDKQTHKLAIIVENKRNAPLFIYDSMRGRIVPNFLSVRVETADGVVMSNNKVLEDGFLSSNVFESLVLVPPVGLVEIQPGEKISAEVGLQEILRNTQQYFKIDLGNLSGRCLVFKMSIFADAQLSRSTTQRSSPVCF